MTDHSLSSGIYIVTPVDCKSVCVVKYAHHAVLAQWLEHGLLNSLVNGSNPLYRTIYMKYWISDLTKTSVKSPYAVRLTLIAKPNDEQEILKWLEITFGHGNYIVKFNNTQFNYAEIFLKNENDVTSFILRWGESLQ